jgi:CRISPR-associated protein Cmr4
MFLKSCMLFIYTESPLHAGTGTGLGAVDLPIQRERYTGYPIVQASGIKGALRSEAPNGDEKTAVFGHEKAEHAGALSPGDARILLFPVRSLAGVFAWTTSCNVLARFRRDALTAGLGQSQNPVPDLPASSPDKDKALASGTPVLLNPKNSQGTAVLEEFAFEATVDAQTTAWAKWLAEEALPSQSVAPEYQPWVQRLKDRLLILPEDALRDFLLHATEVVTRIRLEPDSKTVVSGALWTQEHLPGDSLLYTLIHATKLRLDGSKPATLADPQPVQEAKKVLDWAANSNHVPHRIQLGGDETVGRGIVRLRWNGGAS